MTPSIDAPTTFGLFQTAQDHFLVEQQFRIKKLLSVVNDVWCLHAMLEHTMLNAAVLHVQISPVSCGIDTLSLLHSRSPWQQNLMIRLDSSTGTSSAVDALGGDTFFADVMTVIIDTITLQPLSTNKSKHLRCLQAVYKLLISKEIAILNVLSPIRCDRRQQKATGLLWKALEILNFFKAVCS